MTPQLKSYYKNREQRILKMRDNRNTPRIRASGLLSGAKKRAAKAGIVFELDLEWVAERVERGFCEVSGIPFSMVTGRDPFAPSLDRTDPTKGYTKDNVKVVVWCYNSAKGIGTHEDVIKLADALAVKYVH